MLTLCNIQEQNVPQIKQIDRQSLHQQMKQSNIQTTQRQFNNEIDQKKISDDKIKEWKKWQRRYYCRLYRQEIFCTIFSIFIAVACIIGLFFLWKYFYPQPPQPIYNKAFTVPIISTGGLGGKFFPTRLTTAGGSYSYNYGGLSTLLSYKNILSQEYKNNILYLDAGNQFFGGIQSSKLVSSGEIMNDFFKSANLTASTLGDEDFEQGPDFLQRFLKGRSAPVLVANLKSQTGKSDFLPNQKGSMIVNLPNGIKIGLIGIMITDNRINSKLKNKKFPAYQFLDHTEIVLNKSIQLKASGVHSIILIVSIGNQCLDMTCPQVTINNLIDKLPLGTFDVVIHSHRLSISYYTYKDIPILGTQKSSFYTNYLFLGFDENKRLISRYNLQDKYICEYIFQRKNDCNYIQAANRKDLGKQAGDLVSYKFRGVKVEQDRSLTQIINSKWDKKMGSYRSQLIVNSEITLAPVTDKEYQLGNLFTNLLHQIVPNADFTILKADLFRTTWYPGPISYEKFFNMFPFEHEIITFTMSGSELASTLGILQSGYEFFPTWNLQSIVQVKINTSNKKVLTSTFANGSQINPNSVYKGVTTNYLINGGDRFSLVTNFIYNITNLETIGNFRESVKPYLKKIGTIRKGTLIDPQKPRIVFAKI